MKKPTFTVHFHIPGSGALHRALRSLSFLEWCLVGVLFALLIASTLSIVLRTTSLLSLERPAPGGTFTEGIIGTPRLINPVLASTDADRDLAALVYAGLMKPAPDGVPELALAATYSISDDGLTYTFAIRPNAVFHDGQAVTADDVLFTVSMIQNPLVGSPLRIAWEGIAVKKLDDRTVQFTLSRPFAPFLAMAGVGILPAHIWADATPQTFASDAANLAPIGAGPFKIAATKPSYTLARFDKYVLGAPYLFSITLKAYANESALIAAYKNGDIDAVHSLSPETMQKVLRSDSTLVTASLPRVFAAFFNQSRAPVLANAAVRQALSLAAPRSSIVQNVLKGFGTAIDGPLPSDTAQPDAGDAVAQAQQLLEKNGWAKNANGIYASKKDGVLAFTLATANTPELTAAASMLTDAWRSMGADVTLQTYDLAALQHDAIRPRAYDALLFGEAVGRSADLYPFWHSSQRLDPGLGLALYANVKADDILKQLRATTDASGRGELLERLDSIIKDDAPAAFLYSPELLYAVPKVLKGIDLGTVENPSERFLNANQWYIKTRTVWHI